ncbi:MAG TPA: 50S ribosomal protein L11 [Euryarchaeota archaeon]|nr:MAG: 50S ribosomal protein L11 [Thermoplasmatales archaeon ex4484_6]RLF69538.1 MAG: 50S ribosomal protein L11 [Thermoplasmata archaeon]HHD15478.1 50S ribosomal protein L11 [Euryarchaeota archaeon]
MPEKIEALVDGGKASAGPPLGPALGPLGVNIGQIIAEINSRTKDFEGMKVPVVVFVDPKTKEFSITVGTPPTSSLIMQELGIEKSPGDDSGMASVNLPFEKAVKVARMKRDTLLSVRLEEAVKEVLGTAVSMHISVDGKDPKEVQKLINEGHYRALLDAE